MLGIPGANLALSAFGGGFVGDIANQLITTGGSQVKLENSTISGITTAVTVGAFGATGQVTSSGLNYVKDYAIRGAFAGVTGDVTYQYLNNGITKDEYGNVTGYSINQAFDNYNSIQTLKSGSIGAIMAPIGAKVVESSINKWGPYSKFDLNDPESFRGAKLKNVEKYMDRQLKDNLGYGKKALNNGIGVKYNNGKQAYFLNNGYEPIPGGDLVHTGPYLKTTVGSKVVRVPLK